MEGLFTNACFGMFRPVPRGWNELPRHRDFLSRCFKYSVSSILQRKSGSDF